jgi:catechol 2,3-dioxygenase-like lactoylglutathione lyase family enzyme|tara:strand:- start:201 stop:707 length:507 start_codon:yes stop_codon:yes gene_type:complete
MLLHCREKKTMSHDQRLQALGLPPIDQIGFVVKDMDAWVARFDPVFGPFSFMDGSVAGAEFRGRTEDVQLRLGFGRSGDVEIELIEWQSGVSPHSEFIESGREGMHHLRFRVEDTDHWINELARLGYTPFWYKRWNRDTVFSYLECPDFPLYLELLQMPQAGAGAPEL